ncbi:MAG: mechanosensitive ion channel [Salibacteraceae bacterium]
MHTFQDNMNEIVSTAGELIVKYGMQLLGAIAALIIGIMVINLIVSQFSKTLAKRNVDPSLIPFLRSLVSIGLKAALFITIAGMVGFQMTSFVAIIGAAGLAVGLALQGTLQNFAGGVIILLFKPFKVGDFIEAQGYSGTVKEIQIFNTLLTTGDNKVIIIPNGGLANSSLVNYSKMPTRRVDFSFGIGYNDDFNKAKEVILGIINADERILKDPAPLVRVGELADSSVNITTRVWVNASDYWSVHWDMLERVKTEFDKNKISIPYPQMDVHVSKEA